MNQTRGVAASLLVLVAAPFLIAALALFWGAEKLVPGCVKELLR